MSAFWKAQLTGWSRLRSKAGAVEGVQCGCSEHAFTTCSFSSEWNDSAPREDPLRRLLPCDAVDIVASDSWGGKHPKVGMTGGIAQIFSFHQHPSVTVHSFSRL